VTFDNPKLIIITINIGDLLNNIDLITNTRENVANSRVEEPLS